MRIVVVLALLSGCASLAEKKSDPFIDTYEQALDALERGDTDTARGHLADVVNAMEDTDQNLTTAAQAMQSDTQRDYRGRPHERVFAPLLLATLDVAAGHCDLAMPAVKTARLMHRVGQTEATALPWASMLELRCGHSIDDATPGLASMATMNVDVVLTGIAPHFVRSSDGKGETAVGTASERVMRIHLDGEAPLSGVEREPLWDARGAIDAAKARAFGAVLDERNKTKTLVDANKQRMIDEGNRAWQGDNREAAAAQWLAGAAFAGGAAMIDVRRDVRSIEGLPAIITLEAHGFQVD
jgi:hypothetical protein